MLVMYLLSNKNRLRINVAFYDTTSCVAGIVDAACTQSAKYTALELLHVDPGFVITIKTGSFTSHASHYRVGISNVKFDFLP